MVREYVERLYAPAALSRRALKPAAARDLAAWKTRVRAAWPQVTVDHVEATADTAVGGTAELGSTLALRVRIALGGLDPEDVEVQVVAGRVDSGDAIAEARTFPLKPWRPRPGGPLAVRGAARPRPHGPLRLHRARPARPSAARLGRGTRPRRRAERVDG